MKLTLRELFLLVALVAMACGWWVESSASQAAWRVELRRAHDQLDLISQREADWQTATGVSDPRELDGLDTSSLTQGSGGPRIAPDSLNSQQYLATIEAQQKLIHQLAVEEATAKAQLELLGTQLRNETEKNRILEKKLRRLDQYRYVPEIAIDD